MPSWPTGTNWPTGTSWPASASWPAGTSWPSNVLPIAPNEVTSATKRFWHDGQDNATITIGTGVSLWTDKFLNGYDVAEGTGAKQPTVVTTAFGGRQALRFTRASSQELGITNAGLVSAFAGGTDTAYEWWFVLQHAGVTLSQYFAQVDNSASATTYNLLLVAASAWTQQRRDGVGANQQSNQTGVTPVLNTPYILRCSYNGTTPTWSANGTALSSAAVDTNAMTLDRLIYGAFGNGAGAHASFHDGWIGESIGYTGTLSGGDAAGLAAHLRNKWGL